MTLFQIITTLLPVCCEKSADPSSHEARHSTPIANYTERIPPARIWWFKIAGQKDRVIESEVSMLENVSVKGKALATMSCLMGISIFITSKQNNLRSGIIIWI